MDHITIYIQYFFQNRYKPTDIMLSFLKFTFVEPFPCKKWNFLPIKMIWVPMDCTHSTTDIVYEFFCIRGFSKFMFNFFHIHLTTHLHNLMFSVLNHKYFFQNLTIHSSNYINANCEHPLKKYNFNFFQMHLLKDLFFNIEIILENLNLSS